jgi:flavin-dependent dehydrogenase
MSCVDLVVIGGGPAGTAAAITAARNGAQVRLFEAGRFPRHKVCGEFVSAESLELLGSLLDKPDAGLLQSAARIGKTRLFVDGQIVATEVEPAAASIPRFDLDAALWGSAKAAGVEASSQVKVLRVTCDGSFTVKTPSGEVQAKAVINASGRWSNLRTPAEQTTKEKWIGLKAHFGEANPAASVDLYFFPGGYCGVQPVGKDHVNACAMVKAAVATELPEVLELHPELKLRSRAWQRVMDSVSVAPLFFETPQPVRDGVMMVGDAAGFVDPFVGDGISLALRSGALAAECAVEFIQGRKSRKDALERYQVEYERRFASIFRSSSRLRELLTWPRAVRAAVLFLLRSSPGITRQLVKRTR